jgi:hypothetical protein
VNWGDWVVIGFSDRLVVIKVGVNPIVRWLFTCQSFP